MVLEASLGYAALCSVVVMDKVAEIKLRNKLREEREAHGHG